MSVVISMSHQESWMKVDGQHFTLFNLNTDIIFFYLDRMLQCLRIWLEGKEVRLVVENLQFSEHKVIILVSYVCLLIDKYNLIPIDKI